MPDIYIRPFNIGIGVSASSSATTYSIQHTFDYIGGLSSNFVGWISSAAQWYDNTGISGAAGSSVNGNYAFPVSAIRLNVLSGSSQTVVTAKLIQAG
jgi:hypothetical protein